MSNRARSLVIAGAVLLSSMASASPSALWLQPSSKWYGIDGNWSAVSLSVGSPAQAVDVTVSTSLSEIWVVQTAGCSQNMLCTAARGNVYDIAASSSWTAIGAWQLGLDYLGLGGNGDYAMESVTLANGATGSQASTQQTVAAINDTDFYTGFFGLGMTPGRFKNVVAQSPITNLVETGGVIPSRSYGFTAGAYYRGQQGTPLSLTLGGYDANRFKSHGTSFNLNSTSREPEVLLRGITASVSSVGKTPKTWSSSDLPLMAFNESTIALIDSSTPYLWLPAAVCDRFAQALNLTWNETLGLYLFSSNVPYGSVSMTDLSFTFTMSSLDNHDNFGQPLNDSRAVNVTASANAFSQTLRYPFQNMISYGDAGIPYFPLKRLRAGNRAILGRSFLQEAYIITNYETGSFSVYQASFPADAQRNISIVTIASATDNGSPGNPNNTTTPDSSNSSTPQGLTQPQIVGVALGAFALGVGMIFLLWCTRHKSSPTAPCPTKDDEWTDDGSLVESSRPRSPISRFLSKIVRRFPGNRGQPNDFEVDGSSRAVEAPATERAIRHEMAAHTQAPVELEAMDTFGDDATQFGTEDMEKLSDYETARRKMQRQLQGPVPAYSSPDRTSNKLDKCMQDPSPVAHYRPQDQATDTPVADAPVPAPAPITHPSLSHGALPSPASPGADWQTQHELDLPSPLTSGPSPSRVDTTPSYFNAAPEYPFSPDSQGRPPSGHATSPASSTAHSEPYLMPPQPAVHRPPIDPLNVVCLGPLRGNIKLSPGNQSSIPRLIGPDGEEIARDTTVSGSRPGSPSEWGTDTLGSDFTLDEQDSPSFQSPQLPPIPKPVHTTSRIDGVDLVHVPQPAPHRYSWEQER